jgi:hypothetical protein
MGGKGHSLTQPPTGIPCQVHVLRDVHSVHALHPPSGLTLRVRYRTDATRERCGPTCSLPLTSSPHADFAGQALTCACPVPSGPGRGGTKPPGWRRQCRPVVPRHSHTGTGDPIHCVPATSAVAADCSLARFLRPKGDDSAPEHFLYNEPCSHRPDG